MIRKLVEYGLNSEDATPAMLKEVAEEVAGLSITVSENDFKTSIDIPNFIEKHCVRGGPAPVEVHRMLKSRKKCLLSWT